MVRSQAQPGLHGELVLFWHGRNTIRPARVLAPRARRRLVLLGEGVRGEGGVSLSPAAAASGTIVPRRNYSVPYLSLAIASMVCS